MTLIAFVLLFLTGAALVAAVVIGLIQIWARRGHFDQPEWNGFPVHLDESLPEGVMVVTTEEADDEILGAMHYAFDTLGAFRFPTTPPAPYDWKADRGLR